MSAERTQQPASTPEEYIAAASSATTQSLENSLGDTAIFHSRQPSFLSAGTTGRVWTTSEEVDRVEHRQSAQYQNVSLAI
jgi:hypothetical protein